MIRAGDKKERTRYFGDPKPEATTWLTLTVKADSMTAPSCLAFSVKLACLVSHPTVVAVAERLGHTLLSTPVKVMTTDSQGRLLDRSPVEEVSSSDDQL
jgi:hypothetical protein